MVTYCFNFANLQYFYIYFITILHVVTSWNEQKQGLLFFYSTSLSYITYLSFFHQLWHIFLNTWNFFSVLHFRYYLQFMSILPKTSRSPFLLFATCSFEDLDKNSNNMLPSKKHMIHRYYLQESTKWGEIWTKTTIHVCSFFLQRCLSGFFA